MSTDRKIRKAVLATFVGGALIFGGGTADAQYDDYDAYDEPDDGYDGYDSEDPVGPGTDPGTSPGGEAPVSSTGSLPRTGGGTLLLAGGALAAGAAATRRFLLNR
jgi:hypothetical protein